MKRREFLSTGLALGLVLMGVLIPACQRSKPRAAAEPDSVAVARADSITVRNAVLDFGTRLKQVPLLAPDTTRMSAMQRHYSGLVSPMLIQRWAKSSAGAAGRRTSSPWPDRIEIANISRKSARVFLVDGAIVERTSSDSAGISERIPVRLAVWKGAGKWLITSYDEGAPHSEGATDAAMFAALTPERAAAVLQAYYDAIRARKYQEAYAMWEADGAASGQSMIEFLNTYAQTKAVEASIGAPGPIGAAAGSRYVEIPVRVVVTNVHGAREAFTGAYTLRASVVDGATAAQRTWHIYGAKLTKERAA